MIPSIELRLDSMRRALTEVIMPAIDPTNSLAVEQAGLMAAHIGMLLTQWNKADSYAQMCLADLSAMTRDLAPDGGPLTQAAAAALRSARQPSAAFAEIRYKKAAAAVDELVRAAAIDAEEDFRKQLHRDVIAFSGRQASRDRAWFAASGFDVDASALPQVDVLLARYREQTHD